MPAAKRMMGWRAPIRVIVEPIRVIVELIVEAIALFAKADGAKIDIGAGLYVINVEAGITIGGIGFDSELP